MGALFSIFEMYFEQWMNNAVKTANECIFDELLLDLAAKSRNTVSADLPDYIMEKDIVRAALRVAKEVDATDEEWQTFMKMLKERKR